MTDREKLIELLSEDMVEYCNVDIIAGNCKIRAITFDVDRFADFLISNGVTVQKWIPVSERLPEDMEKVIALSKSSFGSNYLSWLIRYNPKKGAFYDYDSEWGDIKIYNVTHWMPLPNTPEE